MYNTDMKTVTIRNLSESVISTVRALSKSERRSINNEFVILIETGLNTVMTSLGGKKVKSGENFRDPKRQAELWKEIAGKWVDTRETPEIIRDIIESRGDVKRR